MPLCAEDRNICGRPAVVVARRRAVGAVRGARAALGVLHAHVTCACSTVGTVDCGHARAAQNPTIPLLVLSYSTMNIRDAAM